MRALLPSGVLTVRAALAAAVCLGLGCAKDDAPAHLEKARAALFAGQAPAALEEYKKALDVLEGSDTPEAMVYRARALRGAADTYHFQLRDFTQAVAVYRELITRCPEAPETVQGRIHLATLLRHEFHDLQGAIAELTQALARNPPQSAELAYQVAEMYFSLSDFEQCQLEAASVAKRFENSAYVDDALFLRAQALAMSEGREAEARRAFQYVVDRFPDSPLAPHALVELGRLKAQASDYEGAIETWVLALKAHPDPKSVQASITRARSRIVATTPRAVGDAVKAFDWDSRPPPKTSAEAVGGTAQEAEAEASMPSEHTTSPTPK